jgi:hypothetical protein
MEPKRAGAIFPARFAFGESRGQRFPVPPRLAEKCLASVAGRRHGWWMGSNRAAARMMRQPVTILSLALMLVSIWNASACAFICANDEGAVHRAGTAAPRPGQCHEGRRAGHHGTSPAGEACPSGFCARLQPASQTSRPAEVTAPQQVTPFAFFPEAPSGVRPDLTAFDGRTSILDQCLGPPIPPSLFTVLRT